MHCDTVGRHVPVLLLLTRSLTISDYKIHFDHLFQSMECQSFDQFLNKFPGNISNFSSSKQAGFRTSLIDLATTQGYETTDVDKLMQRTYKFCKVRAYFPVTFGIEPGQISGLLGAIAAAQPVEVLLQFHK